MKTKKSLFPLLAAVAAAAFFTTTELHAEPRREGAPTMVMLGTLPSHDRHPHAKPPRHTMPRHKRDAVCITSAHSRPLRAVVPQLRIEIVL